MYLSFGNGGKILQHNNTFIRPELKLLLKLFRMWETVQTKAILLLDGLYAKIPTLSLAVHKRNVEAKFPFIQMQLSYLRVHTSSNLVTRGTRHIPNPNNGLLLLLNHNSIINFFQPLNFKYACTLQLIT